MPIPDIRLQDYVRILATMETCSHAWNRRRVAGFCLLLFALQVYLNMGNMTPSAVSGEESAGRVQDAFGELTNSD